MERMHLNNTRECLKPPPPSCFINTCNLIICSKAMDILHVTGKHQYIIHEMAEWHDPIRR